MQKHSLNLVKATPMTRTSESSWAGFYAQNIGDKSQGFKEGWDD
jgi:hypothetical protein